MPVMDGLIATIEIRTFLNSIHCGDQCIIVGNSASGSEEFQVKCKDSGMNEFLEKPIN